MKKENISRYMFLIVINVLIIVLIFVFGSQVNSGGPKKEKTETEIPAQNDDTITGYHIQFGDNFNSALANQDDLGISILLAIDCSGSMEDRPASGGESEKYKIASRSLTDVILFLQGFYNTEVKGKGIILKLGLLRFNYQIEILFPLEEMNDAKFQSIVRVTSNTGNFMPEGKTAIGDALKTGTEMLMQSGTIFRSLIIITDGENTTGDEPGEVLEAIVENRNNKNRGDFPVLTSSVLVSFIGFDIDSAVFNDMHDLGARVMSAGDKLELDESLKNLFIADISRLEAR